MPVRPDRLEVSRAHVAHRPGQLQVLEEPGPIVHPPCAVLLEPGEEHVGLEGVEGRGQSAHVGTDPFQPGLALDGVGLGLDIGPGGEPTDPGQDECRLRGQRGHLLLQRIELLGQQRPMDGEFAETPALRRLEVGEDQGNQPRDVRPPQTGQERPPLGGTQGNPLPDQPVGFLVGQAVEAVVLQDPPEEGLPRNGHGVELCRQVGPLVGEPRGVVELQAQPFAQMAEGPLGIRAVGQERLPVLKHPALFGVGKALRPLGHRRRELLGLSRRLLVQRVEKVVVLGARHQLTEHRLPVGSQCEGLDESDVGVGAGGQRGGQGQGGQAPAAEEEGIHGRVRWQCRWRPREAPFIG